MVSVSASVNLPLHRKVQKFSSGTGSPGWLRKKGRKTVVAVVYQSTNFLNAPREVVGATKSERFLVYLYYCISE